ncbi:unnamed protein product [Schistocephalus solidus]|uniref:VOC domain-containing protein n=1 Tax=Schistocephalus solidus TaxID=70667 RepID=A0A183T1M0_SCHSO|nr:unnamed protein product [Schistocephalus solidus]
MIIHGTDFTISTIIETTSQYISPVASTTTNDWHALLTSRIGLVGHLRIHRTETGEPVAAPSQSHLPQHGVDAANSGPREDFRVRDRILTSQLQYSVEAAEMEIIQLPGLGLVDGPGLRFVKECCQYDGLVHLQFGVHVNTVLIPHGGLQPAEGLTGFVDPLGNLVIDSPLV